MNDCSQFGTAQASHEGPLRHTVAFKSCSARWDLQPIIDGFDPILLFEPNSDGEKPIKRLKRWRQEVRSINYPVVEPLLQHFRSRSFLSSYLHNRRRSYLGYILSSFMSLVGEVSPFHTYFRTATPSFQIEEQSRNVQNGDPLVFLSHLL